MRAAGIEPATNAWEAFILPLNYARIKYIINRQISLPGLGSNYSARYYARDFVHYILILYFSE